MKNLYIIGGTMGVGKTTVCQKLKKLLPAAVFLDGDWCWDADPFVVTEETKKMVLDNISYLLNGFLHCSAYENVIFCWVMHEQSIIDTLLGKLDLNACDVRTISLIVSESYLKERIEKDIARGKRCIDDLNRSIQRIPLYEKLHTQKIFTDGRTADETAELIATLPLSGQSYTSISPMDYSGLKAELEALSEGIRSETTLLSNASSLIYHEMPGLNWCGFYLREGNKLFLGPFQGKPACTVIPFEKGVCGTCARTEQTILVPDVHEFPGHIACDSASRSELVLPVFKNGNLFGVLDMDSPRINRFSDSDRDNMEAIVRTLEQYLS